MSKYKIFIIIFGLALLLLAQKHIVMPFVYKIVQSDLFLVDSKDQGGQTSISTPLTELAFSHCNHYIKTKVSPDNSINFPKTPLNAWSLGNYQFVINAEVDITNASTGTTPKKYICRINYKNGENIDGATNIENWSIEGLSGLDF